MCSQRGRLMVRKLDTRDRHGEARMNSPVVLATGQCKQNNHRHFKKQNIIDATIVIQIILLCAIIHSTLTTYS